MTPIEPSERGILRAGRRVILAAFIAGTILGPTAAGAVDRIKDVDCKASSGSKTWTITVELDAETTNLDRKWVGASINVGGRWVDLDHHYLVSSEEHMALSQSKANEISRTSIWTVQFNSTGQPQASGRPWPTRNRKVPATLRNAIGFAPMSTLNITLHTPSPFAKGYNYTVALWEDQRGARPKELDRIRDTGCR